MAIGDTDAEVLQYLGVRMASTASLRLTDRVNRRTFIVSKGKNVNVAVTYHTTRCLVGAGGAGFAVVTC